MKKTENKKELTEKIKGVTIFMKSEKEFQQAISLLKTRGFVVSLNSLDYNKSVIYQYNFNSNNFEKSSANALMELWGKVYLNSYGRTYSFTEIVLTLPNLTGTQISNYHRHLETLQKSIDTSTLNKHTTALLEQNNLRKEKISALRTWEQLLQHLINNDYFFDNGKFYRFTGSRFVFVDRVSRLFGNGLDYFSPSRIDSKASYFAKHLTNANGVISDWMDFDLQQRILSETESDFKLVSDLVASFD